MTLYKTYKLIKESQKSDWEKDKRLQAMAQEETSFAGWMKKNGQAVGKTNGDEKQLIDMIDKAIKDKKLKISDKYYNVLIDQIKKAKTPVRKLGVMYNNMLRPICGKVC